MIPPKNEPRKPSALNSIADKSSRTPDEIPRITISMQRRHHVCLKSCLDNINHLDPYSTDEYIIEKLVIPSMKNLILSDSHPKLRTSQTWESRVMRYINYATTLIMMIFPYDYPFDTLCMEWIAEHKENGKLTKVPTWEYVCRFAADLMLDDTKEDGEPNKIRKEIMPETIDPSLRYQKPSNGNEQNSFKVQDSTPDDVRKHFQKRYAKLNRLAVEMLYDRYIVAFATQNREERNLWKMYVPTITKKQTVLISDLYHYLWKYQVRLKTGIWHHNHNEIGNKAPDKKENPTLYNLIKQGVHEEEFDFMENYLQADLLRQCNTITKLARETKNKVKKEKNTNISHSKKKST